MKTEQKRTWLTGAHLKWIAMVVMVIDHAAAAFLEPVLLNLTGTEGESYIRTVTWVYMILRAIGRFAFPTFCFLLVEGFYHTSNKAKYLRNLLVFAVISEIPFDLALFNKVITWEYQNVYWTLAAGFIAIWIAEYFMAKSMKDESNAMLYRVLMVAEVVVTALLAEVLNTDYGAVGVAVIFIMYAMHNKPVMSAAFAWVILSMMNVLEFFCFPFIPAVKFYNGERGRQNKYFFYLFYPLHLLILAIIKMIIS